MKTPLGYLIILVFIWMVALMIATSQENNRTLSDNNLRNISLNSSVENNTDSGLANAEKKDHMKNVFLLNRDIEIGLANNIGFRTSDVAPNATAFLIDGYTRPTKDTIYKNLSLLNAAYLSRAVEGTPHGYVTYYN
jgi:hypothetical protein